MSLPMVKAHYRARATATPISFGEADNDRRTKSIAVEFEILDDQFTGEVMTWIGHFGENSLTRTIESLQIAGWQGEDLSELEGAPAASVLASEVSLACEPEQNQEGQWRLKANWINRPRGHFAFKKPLDTNDLRAFAAQMRATVRSVRASGGAPQPGKTAPTERNLSHPNAPGNRVDVRDDIPF